MLDDPIRCVRADGTMKTALFKGEVDAHDRIIVGLFCTKRGAKEALAPYRRQGLPYGTVCRGPDHDRGETGQTRHAWSPSHNKWVRMMPPRREGHVVWNPGPRSES